MSQPRQMRLGLSMRYLGYHIAAWRHPEVQADGATRFEHFLGLAKAAEAEKLDMVFLADGIGVRANDNPKGALCRDMKNVELEPLTLLSAIAACTSRIGLVATASTTYNEPFHIARKYASLDHISKGRAGWNVVTSWSEQEAWNFNRDEHLGYDERYERADEFVDVVTGLWRSWEPEAQVRDKASGIYYDEAKLHVLAHQGKHFKVRGPLNAAWTPQGRPILVQAGASVPGMEIAARHADVVYSSALDLAKAQTYYRDVKGRMAKYGRHPDELKLLPGVTIYTGGTEAEAQRRFKEMQDRIHPLVGLGMLYGHMGDLSGFDVDGPVPDPVDPALRSLTGNLIAMARERNMTIRQLYQHVAAGNSGWILIGSAEQVVDRLVEWFDQGAADGFNFCPPVMPGGMRDLSDFILPEIRRRGLFRTEYEGTTLRQNLGLAPWTWERALAAARPA